MVKAVCKLKNTALSVILMGFHSSATVDVEHDALWEIPTVQGGQTTENLDTAPVRHVAQTVIVVVVEIGALPPTDSATLMFVASPVCDTHTRGHVCTCVSCCRARDSSTHLC